MGESRLHLVSGYCNGRYPSHVATPTRSPGVAADAIRAVAALDDELRCGMYLFIRQSGRPVTRDEAAASVGISRKLAAFHLDKLVDAGVLRSKVEPAGGVRKVGRTPRVYEPADIDIKVSIPARQYDVLAQMLVQAVLTERPDERASDAALRVAGERGEDLGAAQRAQARPGRLGAERALTLAEAVLSQHGFEPVRESPGRVRLRNCPFHPMARQAPELVCGINQAFLAGLVTGLRAPLQATLRPGPGQCCVELAARGGPDGSSPKGGTASQPPGGEPPGG
jgi:predicted ArsR family transcriptional regulator